MEGALSAPPFSENFFRRVTDRVGRRLEESDELIAQTELQRTECGRKELLYVLNDGCMLPHRDGSWKEAKVGVLLDPQHYKPGSGGRRGSISQARYVAVWGGQDVFEPSMRAALDAQKWRSYARIVWLGDGAPGNWTLAEKLAPEAVQILDPGHAIENGTDCAKALFGEKNHLVQVWHERISTLVMAGDVDALVAELMDCIEHVDDARQLKALNDIVRYYRNNQERMDYPFYRSQGWMIGSGIVESAHRYVLQKRMKRSGQHWSSDGGRRMVRLRAAFLTAGAERFYHAINRAWVRTTMRALARNQAPPRQASVSARAA